MNAQLAALILEAQHWVLAEYGIWLAEDARDIRMLARFELHMHPVEQPEPDVVTKHSERGVKA